jgi:hypothetical protein
MCLRFLAVYEDVSRWAEARGIRTVERQMDAGKAGEFNGVCVTMNLRYGAEEKSYYHAHALGSIVRWSLSRREVQGMFDDLRDAKKTNDHSRLEHEIERYRIFEIESSEYAVWLLAHLGHADEARPYSNFMRADLEALTIFHRTGQAPVWRDLFGRWNREVSTGYRQIAAFTPKEIPDFEPVMIDRQEILQRQS